MVFLQLYRINGLIVSHGSIDPLFKKVKINWEASRIEVRIRGGWIQGNHMFLIFIYTITAFNIKKYIIGLQERGNIDMYLVKNWNMNRRNGEIVQDYNILSFQLPKRTLGKRKSGWWPVHSLNLDYNTPRRIWMCAHSKKKLGEHHMNAVAKLLLHW